MTRSWTLVALAVLAIGCSDGGVAPDASPSPTTSSPSPIPSPSVAAPTPFPAEDVPALAAAPDGDASLWLDTIGIPVVAAVRTSTPLAELADVPPDQRVATCRQVAIDLDGIASPQVLTGLAITADAETATLLVGDLQAKGDLLAACEGGGGDLDALVAEVERTHDVAVAWLARLRGDR